MVNINGKEWNDISEEDIVYIVESAGTEESFFYEFKDDRVSTKKFVEEISALANTFGGYIFIGISDEKEIIGCKEWDEQRLHATIHDCITPVPLFDVKKIGFRDQKIVYVLRIEQGPEPPYITNQGKIYQRLSSGSFVVKDSGMLTQIFTKREQQIDKIEKKITIPEPRAASNNINGYIDIGCAVFVHDIDKAYNCLSNIKINELNEIVKQSWSTASAFCVGESVLITPGGIHSDKKLPAHMNNFVEIMADGSIRMRILLFNNDANQSSVNLLYPSAFLELFRTWYDRVIGKEILEQFIYAKKYESLTVLNQFQPQYYYDDSLLEKYPELIKNNSGLKKNENDESLYDKVIVTNDRIPKTGLYTIDRRSITKLYDEYSRETIIRELFYSKYVHMVEHITNE